MIADCFSHVLGQRSHQGCFLGNYGPLVHRSLHKSDSSSSSNPAAFSIISPFQNIRSSSPCPSTLSEPINCNSPGNRCRLRAARFRWRSLLLLRSYCPLSPFLFFYFFIYFFFFLKKKFYDSYPSYFLFLFLQSVTASIFLRRRLG